MFPKVLVRSGGEFLTVRESESRMWELPRGTIEDGEDRFEAASRELAEETGIDAEEFEDVVRVEVEAEACVNCYILSTQVDSPEVEIKDDEIEDYNWVSADEYRNVNWHADAGYGLPAMEFLEEYLEKKCQY